MTASAPEVSDVLMALADCISVLAEQQRALHESLSALLPVTGGGWANVVRAGPAPLPDQAEPLIPAIPAVELRRNYDYFEDLDARLAQLRADGESDERDTPADGE